MFRGDRLLERIYFGAGEKEFFLRFDLTRWEPLQVRVEFAEPARVTVLTE